jgi:hypothetical protein
MVVNRKFIPVQVIEDALGATVTRRMLQAMNAPRLSRDDLAGAKRYILGEPGNRIRRLKDRAAFATTMAAMIQQDASLRRQALAYLGRQRPYVAASRRRQGHPAPRRGRAA